MIDITRVDNEIMKDFRTHISSFDDSNDEEERRDAALRIVGMVVVHGINVTRNNYILHTLENIVSTVESSDTISLLFDALNSDLEFVITNKNASRLIEKVLIKCQNDDIASCSLVKEQAEVFNNYMWLHYPDYLEHNIGSHVVRLWLQFVCGCYVNIEDKIYSSKNAKVCIPMEKDSVIKLDSMVSRFLLNKHMDQLLTSVYVSSFVQLILVLSTVLKPDNKVYEHLMNSLCDINSQKCKDNEVTIPEGFNDTFKSYLIESLILCLPEGKLLKHYIRKYLKKGISQFIEASCKNPNCCALLKCSLKLVSSTTMFVEIPVKLQSELNKFNSENEISGVYLSLLMELIKKIDTFTIPAETALLRSYKRSITEIIQFISKKDNPEPSLGCFLKTGLSYQSNEDDEEHNEPEEDVLKQQICSLKASLLLQEILKTFDPIPKTINKLFTNLSAEELSQYCKEAKVAWVIEHYLCCIKVPEECKLNLFCKLNSEQLVSIACDKFGSRVFDKIHELKIVSLTNFVKETMEESRTDLRKDRFGKFVEAKFFGYVSKNVNQKKRKGNNNFSNNTTNKKRKF